MPWLQGRIGVGPDSDGMEEAVAREKCGVGFLGHMRAMRPQNLCASLEAPKGSSKEAKALNCQATGSNSILLFTG